MTRYLILVMRNPASATALVDARCDPLHTCDASTLTVREWNAT